MSDFVAWTRPVARKVHRCDQCSRKVQPGEKYHRGAGVYDGDWFNWKECSHCEKLISIWQIESYEGTGPDDISEFEPEGYPKTDPAIWLRWYRHLVQYRKQWTRPDGTLYPTPTRG